MPRNYIRKTLRATCYTEEDLQSAIQSVERGERSQYAAAQHYNIPVATLNDRIAGRTRTKSDTLGRPPAIPHETEKRLADALISMEKWGFGLSRQEVIHVVAEFIKLNNIKTPFKNDTPGPDWFINFRKRHELSIKKPQSLEHVRRKMTDPFIIDEYFCLLKETIVNLGLVNSPSQIWNLDETSVCLDPSKTKVVGKKGAVSSRTTHGTGKENITVLTAVNASGKKVTPLIVYKGKYIWDQWMANLKDEYEFELSYASSKKGWMETVIFHNYMKKVLLPSIGEERPVLIIYDGHTTHVDISVVELAKRHDVTILKLPPHTSHLLQPLDVCVFKSFKTRWDAKLVEWQRQNVGAKLPKKEFAELFAEIWHETKPEIIRNGFRKAGIVPFNPNTIPVEKYDPSAYKRWLTSKVDKQNTESLLPRLTHSILKGPDNLKNMCLSVINTSFIQPTNQEKDHGTTSLIKTNKVVSFSKSSIYCQTDPREKQIQNQHKVPGKSEIYSESTKKPAKITILSNYVIRAASDKGKKPDVQVLSELSKSNKTNLPFIAASAHDLPHFLQTIEKKSLDTLANSSKSAEEVQSKIKTTPDVVAKASSSSNPDYTYTFEELLLKRVQHSRPEKTNVKKKRVAPGAEVITRSALSTKTISNEENLKKVVPENEKVPKKEKDHKKREHKTTEIKKEPIEKKATHGQALAKRRKKRSESKSSASSNSSIEFVTVDTDDSEYETMQDFYIAEHFREQEEKENSKPPDIPFGLHDIEFVIKDDKSIEEGNWIVVQFATKKSLKHFVGIVLSVQDKIPKVKFVRKVKQSKHENGATFTYPTVVDISTIKHVEDIVSVLPVPKISRRGQIIFNVDFSKFNVQ